MMRIASSILAGCLLFGTASADRIVEQLESSYELVLNDVTLPGSENGSISFRECDTCEQKVVRVGARTRYLLNGVEMTLADWQRSVAEIRLTGDEANTGVYVHYEIKTSQVNRVRVVEFGRAQR